jgi:hypothetical protein
LPESGQRPGDRVFVRPRTNNVREKE